MFVPVENPCIFLTFQHDRNHFVIKAPRLSGCRGAILGAECVLILLLARNFVLFSQHLGSFAHHHLRHEAQALFTVYAGTSCGTPQRMEICRAGLGPPPACRALPMMVSSTCSGRILARSIA